MKPVVRQSDVLVIIHTLGLVTSYHPLLEALPADADHKYVVSRFGLHSVESLMGFYVKPMQWTSHWEVRHPDTNEILDQTTIVLCESEAHAWRSVYSVIDDSPFTILISKDNVATATAPNEACAMAWAMKMTVFGQPVRVDGCKLSCDFGADVFDGDVSANRLRAAGIYRERGFLHGRVRLEG